MKTTAAALGALHAVAASGIAPANLAHATPMFLGSYTTVQTSSTRDPHAGAHVTQPDQNGIWIVQSSCALSGCLAHVVVSKALTDSDMLFVSWYGRYGVGWSSTWMSNFTSPP